MTWHIIIATLLGLWAGGLIGFAVGSLFSPKRYAVPLVDIPRISWIEVTVDARHQRIWVNGPDGLLLRAYHVGSILLPGWEDRQ